ncbi:hypothetical protein HDV06_004846 [Boothiomyces sp. JEL0866]|nr:hypothetical protein HDV06_004846 [Boothiomyces sp. JEL0866]
MRSNDVEMASFKKMLNKLFDGILNLTQAGDPKKEDFRKYLELLVGLYEEPEKPDSPIEYIKHFLGGPSEVDTEALKHENEELKSRIEEMQAKIDQLMSGGLSLQGQVGMLKRWLKHSDVAYWVGLGDFVWGTATLPLQLLGFEVDPLNTVQFSNHAEYEIFKGLAFNKQNIQDLFQGLILNDFVSEYTHIITGYCGKAESLLEIYEFLAKHKRKGLTIVVDPVLGDDNKLYVSDEQIPIYKQMIALADLITPNGFEAEILSGFKPNAENIHKVFDTLHSYGPTLVLITSVVETIGTTEELLLYGSDNGRLFKICIPKIAGRFVGTGDVFSALVLGHLDKGLVKACELSVDTMQKILENTIRAKRKRNELALVDSIPDILNPEPSIKAVYL